MKHQEEDQGCLSISEFLCQEEFISLDSFEEQNDIYFETHKENQIVNSEILNEVVSVSFKNCHEHTRYGSSGNQFNYSQEKLQFEQPLHSKQIT